MTRTMVEVKAAIDARRLQLAQEPFLRNLEISESADDLRAFVPHLYFYVFAFQDMLRLAHTRVQDPHLRDIARQHRAEDAGHEHWFAHDMQALGTTRDVPWVFSAEHELTRDVSYELIAEILHATDDRVRIVIPLVLEAIGSVFFPRVVDLLERAAFGLRLRYFARSHQQVEEQHDMFTAEGEQAINAIEFEDPLHDEVLALVDRCFTHAQTLADHLERHRAAAVRGS